jgi:anaerobic selenocysteine-containing dehydrogenase
VQSAASEDEAEPGVEAAPESGDSTAGDGEPAADDARAPDLLRYEPPSGMPDVPGSDAYSLRLVATRKLYDAGTLVANSASLEHLAAGTALRLNPADLEQLGLTTGGQVRVSSARTTVVVDALGDRGVPRGSAALVVNQPGTSVADLVDATTPATEVRVETVSGGG